MPQGELMKKVFKSIIITAVISMAAACLVFAGCFGSKPKTFTKEGMSITLTSKFNEQNIVTQTVYYVSLDSVVTGLKEEFSLMPGFGDYTLTEYTQLVITNNSLDSEINTKEGKSYLWFTYEKEVSGKDYFYLATTFKASDAFWLIQFGCETFNREKLTDTFFEWADSVTFGQPSGQDNL